MSNFKYGHPYVSPKDNPFIGMSSVDFAQSMADMRRERLDTIERWRGFGYFDHQEIRRFTIPIGHIPEEQIEPYISEIANSFRTVPNYSELFPRGVIPGMTIVDYPDLLYPERRNPTREEQERNNGLWKSLREMRNPQPEQKKRKIYLAISKLIRIFVSTLKNKFS